MNDIISGNVLLDLSDHFSQFISVNREQIDIKKINIYRRDYSKYSNESFQMMSQSKTGTTHTIMYMIPLKTFLLNLKHL